VIVGASLGGLRAGEALRRLGYDQPILIVGAERHPPYDRPPLSKQVLTGTHEPEATTLRVADDFEAEWLLGTPAVRADLERRVVGLADGTELPWDQLIVATGAHPRRLPELGELPGVHELRTLDDALALRTDLSRSPQVAVIGAGFIGLEVAASCRARGLEVSVLEALPVPLERAIGAAMGSVCADLHRSHGVEVRTGAVVEGLVGRDRVEGVRMAGGEVVPADVVVVGIGVAPSTGWLAGSGVDVADGVVCDRCLRVQVGGRPRPDVVAVGDVARWPHPRYGGTVRIEHWTNAAEQAQAAAKTLVQGADAPPFDPVPFFWSDQYTTKIQFVGHALPDDEVTVVDGDIESGRFVVAYGRDGRLVGALGFSRPAKVTEMRRLINDGAAYPPS
jgi:3-phenylpropionate/trans-cinnamate dioxygenase ferredoxin reductase subunit